MSNKAIHEGIAKALFASAWADYQEEFDTGEIGPGTEIMDVMPDHIDPAAYAAAGKILAEFQDMNNGWSASYLLDGVLSKIKNAETFGHYIGMQAMGHGVGLFDYDIDYEVPHHEFSWLDLDQDNYPDREEVRLESDEEPEYDSPSP